MGNSSATARPARLPDLCIGTVPAPRGAGDDSSPPWLFAPWLDAVPAAQRDLLALLPVLDVNGAVISALGGVQIRAGRPPGTAPAPPDMTGAIAALLCVDPFLRVRDVAQLLARAGIGMVANFPTIQVIDGAAAHGFESADLGMLREARILARFAEAGQQVIGFATTAENGERLLAHGAASLVVHPGPPSTDWRVRSVAARHARMTLETLRTRSDVPLRLFCPDAYGSELDGARALADGLVRYR